MMTQRVMALRRRVEELENAIETMRAYADQTWRHWDADEDMKVGKRLRAMSGGLPGYDETIDEVLKLGKVTP